MALSAMTIPAHWKERAGTWDHDMFNSVVLFDEYRLTDVYEPTDVAIDVGAHIGCFSWLAIQRGFGKVYAFEVDDDNFEILRNNVSPLPVVAVHGAVWRSDKAETLRLGHCSNSMNTGGHCVVGSAGATTTPIASVIPFDEVVITAATDCIKRRVRMVKMDCEGSEFPILYTATTLDLIDEIVGEYHAWDIAPDHVKEFSFQMSDLAAHLEKAGFSVQWAPHEGEQNLGLFRAKRL